MVDFHTHILPNVDDGAKSVEETFNLIKEAKKAGFDSIVSTSHYKLNYYEVNAQERRILIDAISNNLNKQNLDIALYLGNEIHISNDIIKLLENGKACTINNTNYVLFELPFYDKIINLYDIIYELLQHKLIPILAHPERYDFVQKDPNVIYDLIQKGVLMQCNYGSFIGQYGEKAEILIKKFLKNDMVHFLGTDVHKENTIYPQIPSVLEELEKFIGKDKLETITTINPNMALENRKIEIEEPKQITLSLKEKIITNFKRNVN